MSPHVTVSGTRPYPWPYDGRLEPRHLALVVAGWDTRWLDACEHHDDAVRTITELAQEIATRDALVVSVSHAGERMLLDPEQGTVPLDQLPGAHAVRAAGIDGFHGSALELLLRGERRTHLLVAGLGLEAPVHSTMRSANDRGYECLLLTDACAAIVPDLESASIATIEMSGGIFGAVGTCAALLSALPPAQPAAADPMELSS